jgi:hypothetical protein
MHVFPKTEMRLILVDIDPFIYLKIKYYYLGVSPKIICIISRMKTAKPGVKL